MDPIPTYILRGGEAGAERLRSLSAAMRPATLALLDRAGVAPGARVVDLGCGSGEVTVELARRAGPTGRVVGVDRDAQVLEHGRRQAEAAGVGIEWVCADVAFYEPASPCDLIYARFLFSHLADPAALIGRLAGALAPGGRLVLEDIDIEAHVHWPPNAAFGRYVELYAATARRRGADPGIGPRLAALAYQAGLEDVEVAIAMPVFRLGDGKTIARRTLANIGDAAIAAGLCDAAEIARLLEELERHEADPCSLQSLAQVFQVVARA